MIFEMLAILGIFSVVIFFVILIDGLLSGYEFKELRKSINMF